MTFRKFVWSIAFVLIMESLPAALFAQDFLGNVTTYSVSGNEVTVNADTSAVRLVFYKPEVVRVDFMPSPSTRITRSLVIVPDSLQQVAVNVTEGDSSISIATSAMRIVCAKYPLRLSFFDAGGNLLVGEPVQGGLESDNLLRAANFSIKGGESFYGTGERGLSLNLRGLAFDSYNQQHGGYPNRGIPPAMNVNIPFIVSSNHYGIYFDNTYPGHFDIAKTFPGIFTYSAAGGELSYYFISDPTYQGILSDYTWLTGRAPLLPRWAYGYIQSKFGYRDSQDAEQTIERFRTDSIPADAIVFDLYWFRDMGDLDWNPSSWPDPTQMNAQFRSQGFKTIVITEPYIVQSSDNFATADQNGYLAKSPGGGSYILNDWWSCGCNAGLLDITNPQAQSWWWSKYQHIFQTGVSGLWTDLGEPERDSLQMKFMMGPDAEVHNIYDFLWAETLFNGMKGSFPGMRMFNLTRSGFAGIQRFGTVTWSGDVAKTFSGLAVQLPILLNMGMSGIAYHNSDIGGFTGNSPTTPELYTRWMEFGAFCPVMRAHGYDALGGTEPWAFNSNSPSTEGIVRNLIRLRYSLLPYNYTIAHETYETGVPMARPLFVQYPDDPNLSNESSAYMWGDNFLVAPVVASGETSNTFYLPPGKWISFWDDHVYTGGGEVTVPAPIDEVPLLVKSGSIIPMQNVMDYSDQYPLDTLRLAFYPDPAASSSFTLYEDDGKSLDYQSGSYSQTLFGERMTSGGNGGTMEISIGASVGVYAGKPARRLYVCEIHKVSHLPSGVSLDGAGIDLRPSLSSLSASSEGYFYDATAGILYIRFSASADSAYSVSVDSVEVTSVKDGTGSPTGYMLRQNYPNPFNPTTVISYRLSTSSRVKLTVFDMLGREVATLIDGEQEAGGHSVVFDGTSFPSGVYMYVLNGDGFRDAREMLLLK